MLGAGDGWRQRGSKRGERKKLGVRAEREWSTLKRGFPGRLLPRGSGGLSEPVGSRRVHWGKGFAKFHSLGLRIQKLSPGNRDLMAWSEGRKNRFEGDE